VRSELHFWDVKKLSSCITLVFLAQCFVDAFHLNTLLHKCRSAFCASSPLCKFPFPFCLCNTVYLHCTKGTSSWQQQVVRSSAQQQQLCSESSTVRSGTRQQHLWRSAMAAASSLSSPTWIKTCPLLSTRQDLWSRKTQHTACFLVQSVWAGPLRPNSAHCQQ
jgi:hypothetical protein